MRTPQGRPHLLTPRLSVEVHDRCCDLGRSPSERRPELLGTVQVLPEPADLAAPPRPVHHRLPHVLRDLERPKKGHRGGGTPGGAGARTCGRWDGAGRPGVRIRAPKCSQPVQWTLSFTRAADHHARSKLLH